MTDLGWTNSDSEKKTVDQFQKYLRERIHRPWLLTTQGLKEREGTVL